MENKTVIVNGIVSETFLRTIATNSINRKLNCLLLFCDYSEFDIPVGFIFNNVFSGEKVIYSGRIILRSVTQQFLFPLESIPIGWQTISEFEFIEKIPQSLQLEIPEIDNWYSANRVSFQIRE